VSPARSKDQPIDHLGILQRAKQTRGTKSADLRVSTEAVDMDDVPEPYDPKGDDRLLDSERTDLKTCEQALKHFQRSAVVAGKALATINKARLYRETHPTFEDYCLDQWEIRRAHAYRLIAAWPVAAALSPTGDTPESQVRELLPVAKTHGVETAAAVFAELRDQGGKMSAARIKEAVDVLPERIESPDQARAAVRFATTQNALNLPRQPDEGEQVAGPPMQSGQNPVAVLASVADRQRRLYDELGGGLIPESLAADPGRAETLLREIGQYANRTAYRVRNGDKGSDTQ
jgi:hypothetical protein